MTKHAILSPSGFKALMLCPAKPAMERGLPDQRSAYADEGTLAHELAAAILQVLVGGIDVHEAAKIGDRCPPEMHEYVRPYIQAVLYLRGPDGELFVEQAVPIGHITGEEGAEGTSDAVILRDDEIIVVDLKYGKGVEVSAERNPQLMLYALGALEKFGLCGDFKRARMVISQPRVSSAPSEWDCSVDELLEWAEKEAKPAAISATSILMDHDKPDHVAPHCNPHEDACRFCKAKATCPALASKVEQALGAEFTDLTTVDKVEQENILADLIEHASQHPVYAGYDILGAKMDAVGLVEMWCKAIRGEVEKVLLAGGEVAGYKLVAGRKGARAWTDAVEAEKTLKSMRLKKEEMYEFSLISPTTAEKILKATPKRWNRVSGLIQQSDGKPSVAPISDKRPALEIKPVAEEFEAIADDVGDLV